MTQNAANNEPIILIGPMKAGETIIGTLLTERLNCPFIFLDCLERHYTEAMDFDVRVAQTIQVTQGWFCRPQRVRWNGGRQLWLQRSLETA